ncbi:aspartate/glutamate racemase family protein [Nocardioides sp.]|uniref:aspartate/glutamate racemase family protein n=1 Tax=Nocardioides sp. TaxID=35761 RepID=UPI00262338F8|nr:aspartate/glutamate racemase family protein [Nocardioides sp.]
MSTPPRIGFLHTAQVHVETFEALLPDAAAALHRVQPELLARAQQPLSAAERAALGVDVREALTALEADGADVVVCTCSTLGPLAEEVAGSLGVPVVRIDRPMARAAVAAGPRIGVLAAVASTLEPTLALLADEARAVGAEVEVREQVVEGAWALFQSGQEAAYRETIADAARRLADEVDVLVLAQASMAGAVPLLVDLATPVLTSPASAVAAALDRREPTRRNPA